MPEPLRLLPHAEDLEPGSRAIPDLQPAPESPATSPARLRRISAASIKRKAEVLFRQFPGALGGDEESIHQLRVCSRRLRVALSLLATKPEGRRVTRARRLLQLVMRTAGQSRDLDVLFQTYCGHLAGLPSRTPEQRCLRKRLAGARRRGRRAMINGLLDLEISRLRGDLRELSRRGGASIPEVDQRFRTLCLREGRALLDGFLAVGATLDPDGLHALRRRARRMRYAIEIAQEILDETSGAAKPWKTLQDLIGSLHDHHVLAQWFEAQAAADEKRGKSAMAAAARAEAAWARSAMASLHDDLVASRPSAMLAHALAILRCTSEETSPHP